MPIGGAIGGSNFQHGTHGALSSLTDFTTHMVSVDFASDGEKIPADVWALGFHIYENGFKNITLNAVYKCNDTIEGQLWAIHLADDAVDWQLGPNGITTGKMKFTGTAEISKISAPVTVNQILQVTAEFSMTTALTQTTFS